MKAILIIFMFACSFGAQAELVKITAQDGSVVKISTKEPNLIEASDGKISSFVFSEGMFTQTIDAESGVVYFRPLNNGPRSGFVETIDSDGNKKRFSLVLVPDENWSAQRIVIRNEATPLHVTTSSTSSTSASHVNKIKELVRKMQASKVTLKESVDQSAIVIGDIKLIKVSSFEHGDLIGELHQLVNYAEEEYIVDETLFHTSDLILAISASKNIIQPQQSVNVYLIKRKALITTLN